VAISSCQTFSKVLTLPARARLISALRTDKSPFIPVRTQTLPL
jgi:hypothetical protein